MIQLKTDEFLSKEKKELLKRVTIYIGKKIERSKLAGEYYYNEIARTLKVQNARISEWINYHNYNQNMSEKDLSKCIEEEIVNVQELIDECGETEKEKEYLARFKWYENKPMKELIEKCEEAGIDVMAILQKELNGKLSE